MTVTLQIILERPPAGVDFGLQKGRGKDFEVIGKQRSTGDDLVFSLALEAKPAADQTADFSGPFVQGRPGERFFYIDIGKAAGQFNSEWSRRLKVPLSGIAWPPAPELRTRIAGTAKDGGPNCATPKPFAGWSSNHFKHPSR